MNASIIIDCFDYEYFNNIKEIQTIAQVNISSNDVAMGVETHQTVKMSKIDFEIGISCIFSKNNM